MEHPALDVVSTPVVGVLSTPPVDFLQEANGNHSTMRLMCLIQVGAAVVCALLTLLLPGAKETGVMLTTIFLTSAVGGKLVQKPMEAKPLTIPVIQREGP